MGILKIMGGGYRGEQFEIQGGCATIGSSVDCDVYVPSSKVSPRHAQIFVDEKVWWLRDLGTITGTILRKKQVQQTRLNDGDEFSIGDYRLNARNCARIAVTVGSTDLGSAPCFGVGC